MKYIYSAIFLCLANYSNAQLEGFPLIDTTSEWYFEGEFIYFDFSHCDQIVAAAKSSVTYFIQGDTTIMGENYFKLFTERIDTNYCLYDPSIQWINNSIYFQKHIREGENKIYIYDTWNQEELILWDYNSISIGDSLSYSCVVSTIDTLFLLNQPYLKYNCDCNSEFLIQAIGTKRNLFASLGCGIGIEGDWKNMCYRKNGFVINIDPTANCVSTGDSSIYVSNKDFVQTSGNKIYPNPTLGLLQIDLFEISNGNYTLYSVDGKRMLSKQFFSTNQVIIDLSNFNKGMYFLILQSENGKVSQHKILKI